MDSEQARNIIIKTFENRFDKNNFIVFLKNLLKYFEEETFIYQGNYIPDAFKQYISSLERIGKYTYDNKEIDLLIVQLKRETSLEQARTMQRNFIAWYLKGSRGGKLKDAGLVAFVSPDNEDWRFSLVKMDYRFEDTLTGNVKVKEEFTSAKRWSFLVGKNEKSHTAQTRFVPILEDDDLRPTIENLEKAFNVEVVTNEFFKEYRDLFIKTKQELDKVTQTSPSVAKEFQSKNINTVDFAKKLLGQITFLYFLQKKGWFGVEIGKPWGTGPKDFMRRLFSKEFGNYQNFYNDILEPLFYEALRTDRTDADHYYSRFNCKLPFLNGGLFDPINNYNWVDAEILIPDKLFSNNNRTKEGDIGNGILDIFDRFNFTVNEEEPLEKEVALDPELLGKIYEKLNAIRADNFDKYKEVLKSGKKGEETKFNKEYGVYYTPREIVHYMCQESLINYLESSIDIPVYDIEKLIKIADLVREIETIAIKKEEKIKSGEQKSTRYDSQIPESIKQYAKEIDNLLAEIKVCDPAVGSGAFPIGMMHEIVKLRQLLALYRNTGILACDLKQSNTDIPVCEQSNTGILACAKAIPVCEEDIQITRRNLPHWTKSDSIYWVTFRLADSVPQEKINQWKDEYEIWLKYNPKPWDEEQWKEYDKKFGRQFEDYLDKSYGSCILAMPEVRKIVMECLFKFHNIRHFIHAVVIMPNHIHLLIEPFSGYSFSELLKGIKGASANYINKHLHSVSKKIWMEESYDHIVRSEKQYFHFIRYIKENPIKANLSDDKYSLYTAQASLPVNKVTQAFLPVQNYLSQTVMSELHYELKRHCIENSLYGVDIDPGAIEICKLRFWLSMIVDEENFYNIKPLPNLDYKVVCGNSLLGVEKDLFNEQAFSRLEELKPQHFNETNPTKKQELKNEIDKLIFEITKGHKEFDFEVYFSEVFHKKKGFDIVIGNPPYIKEYTFRNAFDGLRKSPYYKGKMDIWYLFACKGIDLLRKETGVLTFIAQNNWVTSYGASIMRNKVIQDTQIMQMLDFGSYMIFESSDIQTMIMIFKADSRIDNYKFDYRKLEGNGLNFNDVLDLLNYSQNSKTIHLKPTIQRKKFLNKPLTFSDTVIDVILNKLSAQSNFKLTENEIAQGIVTPQEYVIKSHLKILPSLTLGEGIFIISNEERKNIPFTKEEFKLIRPLYTTKELGRYYANRKNSEWVIYTDSKFKYSENIKPYPNIKKHLDKFQKVITSDNKPYGLHRARDEDFFKGEKIIAVRKCAEPTFTYTDFDCYVSATFYVIKTERVNLKYLTALLNSKLIAFWLNHKGKMQGSNYQIDKEPLLVLPLKCILVIDQKPFIELVDKILFAKKANHQADTSEWEREIDRLVYGLYGLTEEEIKIIEGV